jgi:hypothetical protein
MPASTGRGAFCSFDLTADIGPRRRLGRAVVLLKAIAACGALAADQVDDGFEELKLFLVTITENVNVPAVVGVPDSPAGGLEPSVRPGHTPSSDHIQERGARSGNRETGLVIRS